MTRRWRGKFTFVNLFKATSLALIQKGYVNHLAYRQRTLCGVLMPEWIAGLSIQCTAFPSAMSQGGYNESVGGPWNKGQMPLPIAAAYCPRNPL